MADAKKMTMGLIVGNRGFFPDHLAKSGREEMLRVLHAADMDVIALTPEQSKYGGVETREESRRCADLFKQNRDRIDGVIDLIKRRRSCLSSQCAVCKAKQIAHCPSAGRIQLIQYSLRNACG